MLASIPNNEVVTVNHEIYDLIKSGLDSTKNTSDFLFSETGNVLEI